MAEETLRSRSGTRSDDGDEVTGPADPANPDPNTALAADEGGTHSTPESASMLAGVSETPGYKMDPGGADGMSGGSDEEQDTTGYTSGPGRTGTG